MKQLQWRMDCAIGSIFLVGYSHALQGIFWSPQDIPLEKDLHKKEAAVLRQAVRELEEYFSGERKLFNIPLDLRGTSFQQKVWTELRKIPFGECVSYKDIARCIGQEKAMRAVGTANGRNPIPIVIPCHRVISAGGGLGGYSGGLVIKKHLLALEVDGKKAYL